MAIWLLPQIPVLRRHEKASDDFLQTGFPEPSPPSQPGYPTPGSKVCPLTWSLPGGRLELSSSAPLLGLTLALCSDKLPENPRDTMGFCSQAIKSVFRGWLSQHQAHELTETITIWLANAQKYLLRLWRWLLPILGFFKKLPLCTICTICCTNLPQSYSCSTWFVDRSWELQHHKLQLRGISLGFLWCFSCLPDHLSFPLSWELHFHGIGFLKIIFSV